MGCARLGAKLEGLLDGERREVHIVLRAVGHVAVVALRDFLRRELGTVER